VHEDPARLRLGVATDGCAAHVRGLLDHLDPARTAVAQFETHTATLDDVFLALTGHPARPQESAAHTPQDQEPAHV
ncbi:MAG: ABC transporter, partial [Thermocrispum sp.]